MYRGQPIYHPRAGGTGPFRGSRTRWSSGWPRRSTTMPCWSAPTACARNGAPGLKAVRTSTRSCLDVVTGAVLLAVGGRSTCGAYPLPRRRGVHAGTCRSAPPRGLSAVELGSSGYCDGLRVARPFEAHANRPHAVSSPRVVGPAIGVPGGWRFGQLADGRLPCYERA
jgi:hypothetical protein